MLGLIVEQYRGVQSYLVSGGMVMVPLVLVSLCMTALGVERALFFWRLAGTRMNRATAWEHIRQGRVPAVEGGVVGLLVTRFLHRRGADRTQDRFILDEAAAAVGRCLEPSLGLIGVLAALAPLLGLLGTVTGMIATFDVLTLFGTGNPKATAAGISEALITTETGLVVAIPGMYMKAFLERRARTLRQDLEAVACHLRGRLTATAQENVAAPQAAAPAIEGAVTPC